MEAEIIVPVRPDESLTRIDGIGFVAVYVERFDECARFYEAVLGLERIVDMGENARYYRIGSGPLGLYLEGGNRPVEVDAAAVRPGFSFSVESASAMYEKLKAHGVDLLQAGPVEMGQEQYWFQFTDPSGNILEVLGGL